MSTFQLLAFFGIGLKGLLLAALDRTDDRNVLNAKNFVSTERVLVQ